MTHRILLDDLRPGETRRVVTGDEAEHARKVKRFDAGDRVTLMNGRGLIAEAEIITAKRDLELRIVSESEEPPVAPGVDVWGATPKGPRLDDMIDLLTQAGAASWRPLRTARTVVDPREAKVARQDRIVREACKQCGRAWLLRLEPGATLDEAIAPAPGAAIVLADGAGEAYTHPPGDPASIRLLIGPEGGFTPAEVARARDAGVRIARFGPHAMRIETAAVVATGVVLHEARR